MINKCPNKHLFNKQKPNILELCFLDEQCPYSNCTYYHPNRFIENCSLDCCHWYCNKLHTSYRPMYTRPPNNLFPIDSTLIENICSFCDFATIYSFLQSCSTSWINRLQIQIYIIIFFVTILWVHMFEMQNLIFDDIYYLISIKEHSSHRIHIFPTTKNFFIDQNWYI